MLKFGCHLEEMEASALYKIRDEVFRLVGKSFDSRLATHYSFAIASALQVSVHSVQHFTYTIVPVDLHRDISH